MDSPHGHHKGFAPIGVVARCAQALERARSRREELPGIVCLSGFAGLGKTTAAAALAARFDCAFLECQPYWSQKHTVQKLAYELSVGGDGTLPVIAERCAEQLARSGKGVIWDDFDTFAEKKSLVELVRGIYKASGAPMLIIGEELLPKRLERYETFHGRILQFVLAPRADLNDARALAEVYAPGLTLADDALEHLVARVSGLTRRLSTTLDTWSGIAAERGLDAVDFNAVRDWPILDGRSPELRRP